MGQILAAAYCRESESDAITALCNQSDIVKEFIYSRQDLKLYAEYNDLGYTGRNFDRPGWQRLITDLNAGKFECIVVREMSRLGRNYIETAAVVEMLAEKKIRLIGIWDNTVPIVKRIFNEYANGHGFTEIAGGLMEEDVPRPGKAKVWYPATSRAILTNRVYIHWRIYLR